MAYQFFDIETCSERSRRVRCAKDRYNSAGQVLEDPLGIEAVQTRDRIREALAGQMSGGISPGSAGMVFFDWGSHLASAPASGWNWPGTAHGNGTGSSPGFSRPRLTPGRRPR